MQLKCMKVEVGLKFEITF